MASAVDVNAVQLVTFPLNTLGAARGLMVEGSVFTWFKSCLAVVWAKGVKKKKKSPLSTQRSHCPLGLNAQKTTFFVFVERPHTHTHTPKKLIQSGCKKWVSKVNNVSKLKLRLKKQRVLPESVKDLSTLQQLPLLVHLCHPSALPENKHWQREPRGPEAAAAASPDRRMNLVTATQAKQLAVNEPNYSNKHK